MGAYVLGRCSNPENIWGNLRTYNGILIQKEYGAVPEKLRLASDMFHAQISIP